MAIGHAQLIDPYRYEALGSELVTNGTFSVDANWTKENSPATAIAGGIATVTAQGNLSASTGFWSLYQTGVFTVPGSSKNYKLVFTARQVSGTGNFQVAEGHTKRFDQAITGTMTTYTVYFTEGPTYNQLVIGGATSGDVFEVDNVSLKEVL